MGKKNKIHEIRSLQDLVAVATEENIDRLFTDFYGTVLQYVLVKKKHPEIGYIGFNWIDDGKNDILPAEIQIQKK